MFKSAFITIVGLPNAGKSTLLNSILGEELVITNKKAQTTRHRIKGIFNDEAHQLVFSDTPGIIEESAYLLQEQMMVAVRESISDADILLYVIDVKDQEALSHLEKIHQNSNKPSVVVVNKIDLSDEEELNQRVDQLKEIFKDVEVIPVSALNKFNLDSLLAILKKHAPEHPPYFDQDIISDENMRFLVSEMIREQLLTQFEKEIPYSAEVVVEDYKEESKIDKIYATIYLERESQRVIVLGKGGQSIKKLGTESRKQIEKFIQKKVFLSLTIKIRKNWRKDELQLKRFGYLKK